MNIKEMKAAIKAARFVFCSVKVATEFTDSIKISKKQALQLIASIGNDESYEINATYYEKTRCLYIG